MSTRRDVRTIITQQVDPTGTLQRRNPREFERKYDVALQTHLAKVAKRRSKVADQRRLANALIGRLIVS
jgi:hypothetical protein